ncbi:MAG TPA: sigma-54 dependent transcriptional regulator, partial [Candidatus Goldiibacteriota bacterium]|nr:sigma-54 dependent transcriptional regulator [Candidatus Goldiibacteriota bacterium]
EKKKLLVVDDNKSTLRVIKAILEQDGYDVTLASTDQEAIDALKKDHIPLCLMDLKMPGLGGIELFKKLKQVDGNITVIIMTAYGTVESAVSAMKLGVENYLQKPLNFDELKVIIAKLFEKIEMRDDLAILRGQREGRDIFENMIGRSRKMRDLFKKLISVSKSDSTVLITGESGTGKEMAARCIHNLSKRSSHKLIGINLAAIPEGLQESELFGFEKGAFTGAYNSRKGKFEIADKGTVFLDEIANINYRVQAKLLRVIEERVVEPLGGNKPVPIDVRLISATNADLKDEVQKGNFREDLYYRLNVIKVDIPPLRERKADIPLLAGFFLREVCVKNGMEPKYFSDSAVEK